MIELIEHFSAWPVPYQTATILVAVIAALFSLTYAWSKAWISIIVMSLE